MNAFFDETHEEFRSAVQTFVAREVEPHHWRWDDEGAIDLSLWAKAGSQGLLGLAVPEQWGGGATTDYRYRLIISEELARVGAASINSGLSLFDDLVIPYLVDLGTTEQKAAWLPRLCAGTASPALGLTEPGAGSDLRGLRTTAVRSGDGWLLNGSKTFITNGTHADVVVVVARTSDDGRRGLSLFLLERGTPGFTSGQPLDKVGQRGEDVSELFFDNVHLTDAALLGGEGQALEHLKGHLPLERMSIATFALAASEAAYTWTKEYVTGRSAFGRRIADFQNTRFIMAEISTELDLTRTWLRDAVLALNAGALSATDAAKAKWWTTELQQRVISRCLQLHGGYGYMREYPIARSFLDSRVQTIYGGTSEIMKDMIGRDILR